MSEKKKLAVIAFGGNALLKSKQRGTYQEQIDNVTETCRNLIPLIENGYNIVIGHGNGPQVGNVMLQHKAGKETFQVEDMPLNFCVAETQGSIGALIEEGLRHIDPFYEAFNIQPGDPMYMAPEKRSHIW